MQRKWSMDDILYALLEWDEKHGCPPSWDEWKKSGGDEHPSSVTVHKYFGSFTEAIRQAGLTPVYNTPTRIEFDEKLARRLRMDGVPDTEITKQLGISYHVLYKRLGPRPKPIPIGKKRSREQRIADLKKALADGS